MTFSRLIIAAAFVIGLGGAASAAPAVPSAADVLQSGTAVDYVKGKGHKGWKGHKGRHYGWSRGRHYGWYRGRHHGWYKHHRRPRMVIRF